MWTRIDNAGEWDSYKVKIAASANHGLIDWSSGPDDYPCLASSMAMPANGKTVMVTAFVYRADAQMLLGKIEPTQGEVVTKQQDDFNQYTTAFMLTLAYYMRETGICKPEDFEVRLAEAVDLVSLAKGQRRKEILEKMETQDRAIMERLRPAG